jgi:hypothetical protein
MYVSNINSKNRSWQIDLIGEYICYFGAVYCSF